MKETISITVLVEIEYEGTSRDLAIDAAQGAFTRDGPDDTWTFSYPKSGEWTVGRSRAIQARKTKQTIMPRKP